MLVLSEKIVGYSVDFLLMRSFATFLSNRNLKSVGNGEEKYLPVSVHT